MIDTRRLAADSGRLFLAGAAAICVTAFAVGAVGFTGWARSWLALELGAPSGDARAALEIFVGNVRLAAAVLMGAITVSSLPGLRACLDVVCVALAIVNVAVVGVALGAYGPPLVCRVATHTALELAAFSVTASSYLAARDGRLTRSGLCTGAGLAGGLLAAGALAETYLKIGAKS